MAIGKKTGGRDFKPGNPGRPKGTPSLPKRIKEMNRAKIESLLRKYLSMTFEELGETAKDKKTSAIDLMIIKIITESIKKGDQTRLNFILDRMIGRVTDKLDVSSSDGSMSPQLTDEQYKKIAERVLNEQE